jgi:hypothetical protein
MAGWLGHAGKAVENSLAHPIANGTPLVHDDCPPRTILIFVVALEAI